jgi:hypothetical protein
MQEEMYRGFRSYIGFAQNKPEKDYSDYITLGNVETGENHRLFNSLGDQVNNVISSLRCVPISTNPFENCS